MLKNKISLAFYILLALANLSFANSNNMENKDIYFFTKPSCPYCRMAIDYIAENFPNENIKIIDISNGNGMKSFIKKVREYNIDRNSLGTPFIAIGKNYILGWGKENELLFKEYIKQL